MTQHKSDYSIYCAPIGNGQKARNVGATAVRVPFRGELVTWAESHAKTSEATRLLILEAFEVFGKPMPPEFSSLLDVYRRESYAVGAIHSDLAAGRFR